MKKVILILCCLLTTALTYAYDFEVDEYRFTVITSTTAEFAGVNPNHEGEIIIPEYVSYSGRQLSVNTIGESAFESYKASFLRIPQYITNIKVAAFYNAQIDSLHFDDCENPISLQNTINRGPAMSYSKLGSVYIGRTINRTDYNSNADGPFDQSYVKRVYIGTTCSLCSELFKNCRSLERVVVKDGSYINSISSECFRNCSELKHIDLKKGLTSISSQTFDGCTSLDSIYIPSTVTSISPDAFSGATNIKKVISASDSPNAISETSFPGIVYLTSVLYVRVGAKSKYEKTDGWKEFVNIVENKNIPSESYFYKLNLSVSSGGSVTMLNKEYSNNTETILVKEDENITLLFTPDSGYELKSVKINGVNVIDYVRNHSYTISSINQKTSIVVTYAEIPTYLSIKSADNGTIMQVVEKGKAYSFVIMPSEGWDIESVSFNGTNVTSELEGNRYTTPTIISDCELSIVYKQSMMNAVKSLGSESSIRVFAFNGKLIVENEGTTTVLSVYSTSGHKVISESVGTGVTTVELPANSIYIVKVGKERFKVSM